MRRWLKFWLKARADRRAEKSRQMGYLWACEELSLGIPEAELAVWSHPGQNIHVWRGAEQAAAEYRALDKILAKNVSAEIEIKEIT